MSDFEKVTRERVHESLIGGKTAEIGQVNVRSAGLDESWEVLHIQGKAPPFGAIKAGKILIGPEVSPLAGLVYSYEHGEPYIHQVWTDPEFRGRGLARALVAAYKDAVSKSLVMKGPFSPGGRALAKAVGAVIKR